MTIELLNIVSFSGGKDSTAVIHLLSEQNIPIHSAIFCDTGWEFPEMYEHLNLVEKKTGIKIVRLRPQKSFNYWLNKHPIMRKGPEKDKIVRVGYGWPSFCRRWCTGEKVRVLCKYINKIENSVCHIGYAADEISRTKKKSIFQKKYKIRFPLIEKGMTEKDCLKYCKNLGYHWGGLYDHFDRVSCFCCPLQGVNSLRKLQKYYPNLWAKMMSWDKKTRFDHEASLTDLEKRFKKENRQLSLWE